jgi:hypothetical protein
VPKEDVVSMTKTTDTALGAGTNWLEVLKVPGSIIDVDLWKNSVDPGKSVDFEFEMKAMKGTATFSFDTSGEGYGPRPIGSHHNAACDWLADVPDDPHGVP